MDVLKVDDLTVRFGGLAAVNNCSFNIEEKRITCLIGPNGAGKTTIFNLITGFVTPDKGSIQYLGKEIVGLKPHSIVRMGIARTFQDLKLYKEFTVLQNVMISIKERYGERIFETLYFSPKSKKSMQNIQTAQEILRIVGLEKVENEIVNDISYGDQKLVSLARLLATEAEVLLLDEPASGLDKEGFQKLLRVLEKIVEMGKTVVVVEHNMDFVSDIAHDILFLHQGEVLARGTIDEITSDRRLTEIYFGY